MNQLLFCLIAYTLHRAEPCDFTHKFFEEARRKVRTRRIENEAMNATLLYEDVKRDKTTI